MKTIFVTGATSAIGKAILQKIAGNYRLLILTNRRPITRSYPEATILSGGLDKIPDITGHIQSADIILHLAGLGHAGSESEYQKVNYESTKKLISVCKGTQFFIYLSSRCAGADGGAYALSKLQAEEAIKQSCISHVIIRPSEVYGSKTKEGIDALIRWARRYRLLIDLVWAPAITYSPISADELASFVASVIDEPPVENKVYLLSNNRAYTVGEIKEALAQSIPGFFFRLPVPIKFLQALQRLHFPLPFYKDQLQRLIVPKSNDSSLAAADYGFQPVCFLEYLKGNEALTNCSLSLP